MAETRVAPAGTSDPLAVLLAVAATLTAATALLVVALVVGRAGTAPGEGAAVVRWGLPAARLGLDLVALGTIGLLLLGGFLVPTDGDRLSATGRSAVRAAAWWALAWAALAVLNGLLTLADLTAQPVRSVLSESLVRDFALSQPQGRALLMVVGLALVLAFCARRSQTPGDAWLLLILAAVTVVPPGLTGHAADAAGHDLATLSLVLHVLAASAWVGGLAAVLLFARVGAATGGRVRGRRGTDAGRDQVPAAVVAGRYSQLALGCFVVVGLSGVLNAAIRLGDLPNDLPQLWGSRYGWLLLGKLAGFTALGGFGWWHRTRTLPDLSAGRPAAFGRFAAVELVVMALTVALAVALSRSPTPAPTAGLPDVPHVAVATSGGR